MEGANLPAFQAARNCSSKKALCFTAVYYFFSTRDLRGPWADLREILSHVPKHVQFINAGPKIWGSAPKNLGGKNTLNVARFRTPSHFERQYLRNGYRYLKSKNLLQDSVLSRVQ